MKISQNVPLKNLTTMRLGGPASYVITIEKPQDVKDAYDFATKRNLKTFVLGGGANTIARDEGFDGVIIKSALKGIETTEKAPYTFLTARSGEIWDDIVAYSAKQGLTGIEALSLIPGLAGAAPVQNIGAYGQELLDTFFSAEVYDTKDKTFKTLRREDLDFSYRHSVLNSSQKDRYFVLSITLKLTIGKMKRPFYASMEKYIETHHCTDFTPQGIRDIVCAIRTEKLPDPDSIASAGSFFKNIYLTDNEAEEATRKGIPIFYTHDLPNINSGWLIEQCGFKGKLLHGMRISDKAALILINESATSYNDLKKARTEIVNTVKAKFGYTLEQEPVEI